MIESGIIEPVEMGNDNDYCENVEIRTDWVVEFMVARMRRRMRFTMIRSEKFRTWKKNVMKATNITMRDWT